MRATVAACCMLAAVAGCARGTIDDRFDGGRHVKVDRPPAASSAPGEGYSVTPGGGDFFAIRHHRPAGMFIEIVGSEIALNRARNQAASGDYTIDIHGPFPGVHEATAYIQQKWDGSYGRPRRPGFAR
ncbi:MAG: hypothetical protein PHN82_11045 [bacterium]|nr:hypothetical protein [bacterium]